MEKLKVKHDHTLTDIIKVGIFAIFLLLPLLIFAPTAFYYGFNEHADNGTQNATANIEYQYKYDTNKVNSTSDLVINHVYYYEYLEFDFDALEIDDNEDLIFNCIKYDNCTYFTESDPYIDVFNISIYDNSNSYIKIKFYSTYKKGNLIFDITSTTNYIDLEIDDTNYLYFENLYFYFETQQDINNFIQWFNFARLDLPQESDYLGSISNATATIEYNNNNSIINAMWNAWQQVWESPLFNWTGNNNFQLTINTFATVFGVSQDSYITNYLNYVLTLTAIYVIFDIVLSIFVKLTHMFNE